MTELRKYRLIKDYPGSPELGAIRNNCGTPILQKYFTAYPEYWEEVIEKDYQIISFSADFWSEKLATLDEDGRYVTIKGSLGWSLQELLKIGNCVENGEVKIHSVKRLSDGEVFTVGDLVKTPYTDCTRIIGFKNPEASEYFIEIPTGLTRLLSLEKVKQPIFLTHDGKYIFEGDKVHWVKKNSLAYDSFYVMPGMKFFSDLNAYFLTREEAEDYIEKNKVLFITEDGVGIKKGDMIHGIYRTTNAISNTVVGFNNGVCDPFVAIFSTRAAAENYLVQKSHSLSIEDFWEFVCWGGSNVAKSKRLKRLVKERLNLK